MFQIGNKFGYTVRIMKLLSAPFAVLIFVGSLLAQNAKEPFVAADFRMPELYVSLQGTFKIRPLGPKYASRHYATYMSSIPHLQKTFSFSTAWPHPGLTMADAVKDLEQEEAEFKARRKFTYAVLNMNETRELGCVYISPSQKEGYDATVRMWVSENQFVIGFEDRLFLEVKTWIQTRWPFSRVAYLGREITREGFQKLTDKAKP